MGTLRYKDRELKEYRKFIKNLKLVEGDEITVKVKQKFGAEFSTNYTIETDYREKIPDYEKADEGIEYIGGRQFYPHPDGTRGGDSKYIYVFKARKKGNFKIKFNTHEVKVIVD